MTTARQTELLDLAERLLERDGLDAFGIGPLARAAGIKPPSLYKHFASLAAIEHRIIERTFRAFAAAVDDALAARPDAPPAERIATFAATYRTFALRFPQRYRLMTGRPLDRSLLDPAAEHAAMAPLLAVFGETPEHRDRARAAWAWLHGLVSLELAGRFPANADPDGAWDALVAGLVALTAR